MSIPMNVITALSKYKGLVETLVEDDIVITNANTRFTLIVPYKNAVYFNTTQSLYKYSNNKIQTMDFTKHFVTDDYHTILKFTIQKCTGNIFMIISYKSLVHSIYVYNSELEFMYRIIDDDTVIYDIYVSYGIMTLCYSKSKRTNFIKVYNEKGILIDCVDVILDDFSRINHFKFTVVHHILFLIDGLNKLISIDNSKYRWLFKN